MLQQMLPETLKNLPLTSSSSFSQNNITSDIDIKTRNKIKSLYDQHIRFNHHIRLAETFLEHKTVPKSLLATNFPCHFFGMNKIT